MKKIGIILVLPAIIIVQAFSQEPKQQNKEEKQLATSSDVNDNTEVLIGKDLLSIVDSKDAVKVRIGNRALNILESLEGPKLNFEKYPEIEELDQENSESNRSKRSKRFKGHWAGIEFGFNNYLTSGNSMVLPVDIDYMTLKTSKSLNFNLNFSQLSFGLTRHVGFVTGLSLNWNNYKFDGNNNITKGTFGIIEKLDPGASLKKSKLATLFLNIPVLLEIQIPDGNHNLIFAAGPIWAVKLGSHTKMVYQDGPKLKSDGDFGLNMNRFGVTARLGNENFHIYGTYYKTPLFQSGKGPGGNDLYPFEIGVALTFND
jgi:hypothetical protein